MTAKVTWQLPIKTASESNSSEHWTKKGKRHRIQKDRIKTQFFLVKPNISLPCHVYLTRIAPKRLDEGDNLPNSMKYVRDAVSECLTNTTLAGRADGDNRISWEYGQERGKVREYAVRIEIEEVTNAL
jgi:hypothetical protein